MTIKKPLLIKQPEVEKLIHELRGITGLTQEQFAASLGITFSAVNHWEKEYTKPSSLAMQKIQGMLKEMGELGQKVSVKYLSN
ncbi:MAG: helix-turn-helix transcriptional regulator [Nostoc sp. DedSLP03]|uniref:helix-turn-helix domain-containing protein n=1 Tax=Nostoc sp. DedSLP03 TaxID=3075400 RepID=UPI002AD1EC76|nr:helix-turn-helix transcriptional regulator [Nostoc sp. DedSLP03]MDZ7969017.1 helix-turn-helix transcriptional regulator [Nostoc sp. DedSLP03]